LTGAAPAENKPGFDHVADRLARQNKGR